MWATAPYLHNNALGMYVKDPSVRGRMLSFYDSTEKLLWPERRLGVQSIIVTSIDTELAIPGRDRPDPDSRRDAGRSHRARRSARGAVDRAEPPGPEHPVGSARSSAASSGNNQAPDFVLDRGHLFGTELSDEDKRALIEFLKTM